MKLLGLLSRSLLVASFVGGCGSSDDASDDPAAGAGGVAAGSGGQAGKGGSAGATSQGGAGAGGSTAGASSGAAGVAGVAGKSGSSGSSGQSGGSGGAAAGQAGSPAGGSGQAGGSTGGNPGSGGAGPAGSSGSGAGEAGQGGAAGPGGAAGQAGTGGQAGQGTAGGQAGGSGQAGVAGAAGAAGASPGAEFWPGINIAFGENEPNTVNPKYGTDYIYPSAKEFDYYQSKGLTTVRMPFRWRRLQHELMADLDAAELKLIDKEVELATERGMRLILDPHDYASYGGKKVGSAEVPAKAFGDFWGKVAAHYKDNPLVLFGLMNEPSGLGAEQWLGGANAALAAIRQAGAKNLVLVPGILWTGAHSWTKSDNGTVMLGVVDPGNNFIFEVHQYLDSDSSGTKASCVSKTIGSERLKKFTAWLKEHNYRALLGEFGAARNETCYAALDDMLTYIDANRDVWQGWTYWAGGPWWGEYMFTAEPAKGTTVDRPQMKYLEKHAK